MWSTFAVPSLEVHPARQRYTLLARDDDRSKAQFRYESGSFSSDLRVDRDGFVTDYPGLWRRVGSVSKNGGVSARTSAGSDTASGRLLAG